MSLKYVTYVAIGCILTKPLIHLENAFAAAPRNYNVRTSSKRLPINRNGIR